MRNRILHLIPTLSSGGAERQLVNVVCNTPQDEFDHLVCTFSDPYFYAPTLENNGVVIKNLALGSNRPWISGAKRFLGEAKEFKPDLINTWLYDANITARLSKWHGKIPAPIITSLQATDYEPETIRTAGWSRKKVRIFRQIDKITVNLSEPYFVACSQFVADSFVRRLGIDRAKVKVIYNSVNPKSLECPPSSVQKVRQELNLPSKSFVYLNLGRLDPQKNQNSILRAFAEILPCVPSAYLVIIGTGSLENELKALAEALKVKHRVIFTGSRQDVGAFLEIADVFVFPSFFEGLPLALVEAMFKSLPCIVSDIEVLREVILSDKNGMIVNPHRIEEICNAMKQLYENSDLRKRFGANGVQIAHNKFHIRETVHQWCEFYRQIIDENKV